MCMDITYKDKILGTIKEIRAEGLLVKPEHYPHDNEPGYEDEEYCLCGVDIESILEDNNLEWEEEVIFGYIVKT